MACLIHVTATLFDSGKIVRLALNDSNYIQARGMAISDNRWNTGIRLEKIWFGKKYVVIQYYSNWIKNDKNTCEGTFYTAYKIDQNEQVILRICAKLCIEPPNKIDEKAEEI